MPSRRVRATPPDRQRLRSRLICDAQGRNLVPSSRQLDGGAVSGKEHGNEHHVEEPMGGSRCSSRRHPGSRRHRHRRRHQEQRRPTGLHRDRTLPTARHPTQPRHRRTHRPTRTRRGLHPHRPRRQRPMHRHPDRHPRPRTQRHRTPEHRRHPLHHLVRHRQRPQRLTRQPRRRRIRDTQQRHHRTQRHRLRDPQQLSNRPRHHRHRRHLPTPQPRRPLLHQSTSRREELDQRRHHQRGRRRIRLQRHADQPDQRSTGSGRDVDSRPLRRPRDDHRVGELAQRRPEPRQRSLPAPEGSRLPRHLRCPGGVRAQ